MAAGVLIVLVALDTFVSGWLLARTAQLKRVIAELGGNQQVLDHDLEQLAARVERAAFGREDG